MAPHTLVVLWRVTERCDLACPFCAYDRTLKRARREANAAEVLRVGAVLSAHAQAGGARVLMSWLGGEPLLWRPLAEVTQALHPQPGLALSLTTNGTHLHEPALQSLLLEHYAEVTVSVDAIGHAHDGLRGSRGLYQRLARSVRALAAHKRARGAGPLLRMNTVLMRDNANDFGALCRTAARWGIDEITFNQLGGNDRPAYFPANRLLPSQVETLATQMPALREELAQHGVVLRGSRNYLQRLAASSRGAKLAPLDCAPGSRFLWIDEAGVAAPCAHTPREYGVPVSELRSTDDLAMLPARFAALRRVRRAQACADCHSTQHHGKFSAVTPASVTA